MYVPVPGMIGNRACHFDKPPDDPFHGPADPFASNVKLAKNVKEVVSDHAQLQPCLVGRKLLTTRLVPPERELAFLDSILDFRPSVVHLHDLACGKPGIGHDESHAWEKFALVPLDLAHDPPCLLPGARLVLEAQKLCLNARFRRASYRARQMGPNQSLQAVIGWQTDEI